MNQDDNTAPTCAVEAVLEPESAPALPPAPLNPSPNLDAAAPDPFVVGVRVLRMAPAWLLAMTVGCSSLVLVLGWMNAGANTTAVAQPSSLNDARSSRVAPAAKPALARPAEANPSADARAAATLSSSTEKPDAPPKQSEKAQAESAAPSDAGTSDNAAAKFTVQVGSYSNESEANERVSSLRAAGFEARVAAVELQGRGAWYRVQVGRFAERAEASKTLAGVRAKGAAGAIVVPLQN